tara:strand:- start:1754 stop:3694 length:1941 start_codon:yes stop_codon:yes gene_type:complete
MADQRKNPRNSRSELFKSLTKIFSGPIINRRSQTGRRLRRFQLDKHASRFKSASGQQFKRSEFHTFANMQPYMMNQHNRAERYVDFDQMEYMPEIASAMDIYADEMTTHSALTPMLSIHCSNEEIKAVLDSLYHNVMNIQFNLFGWCRSMCKYGDYFLYLDIDEKKGIQNTIGLPSHEVERLEGEDKTNPNYVQFQWNSAGLTLENWQMAHFRVLGNDKYAPYGTSVLEPARRIWRQLTLLEDAMMAYRIVRSPERRVFYVDVGAIPPSEVEQYMQKVITSMKRTSIVNEDTGRVDLRYNPMSVEEDYYIPIRGNTQSRIENLPGGTFTGDIDDVKYLRDKLFSALKVPASYLTNSEGAEEDKTTLAQKDVRFARTIQRLQRAIISELEKIGIIHLYTLGFKGDDLLSFSLSLNNPSKIAELQELEHWKTKFDVAGSATEGYFSRRWVAENMFNMSDDEFLRNQRELFYDRKYDARLAAVAEAVQEEAAGIGGDIGGDLGGDLGGDFGGDDLGGEDLGGEDLGAPPDAAAEEPAGEEDVLLATPDTELEEGDVYTRPGWSGATHKHTKGNPKSVKRQKGVKASYSKETSRPVRRNTHKGFDRESIIPSLPEQLANDRDKLEENEIFETSYEVRQLVESLQDGATQK